MGVPTATMACVDRAVDGHPSPSTGHRTADAKTKVERRATPDTHTTEDSKVRFRRDKVRAGDTGRVWSLGLAGGSDN